MTNTRYVLMRYYVPQLQLGILSGPQRRLEDKFGGLPWGLSLEKWPICKNCGKPQTLIAQLAHDSGRLDLGASGRVLFLFQCDQWWQAGCETYTAGSGANACFIMEIIGEGLTRPPVDASAYPEARVLKWLVKDDGIHEARAADFIDEARYEELQLDDMPNSWYGTRLGSVPYWPQGPRSCVLPGGVSAWRFVFQISDAADLHGPPPDPQKLGCRLVQYRDLKDGDRFLRRVQVGEAQADWRNPQAPEIIWHIVDVDTWGFSVANFAMGVGQVFLPRDGSQLQGAFSWQR